MVGFDQHRRHPPDGHVSARSPAPSCSRRRAQILHRRHSPTPHRFVGFLGWGPKYLSDEYAVLDTRYWPLQDPVVAWISYTELVIMLPLCFMW